MQDAITHETLHDTLAQEWRRRMASRGIFAAVLLAVPVLMAAAIGFSAGGGLPFGISSFASGPNDPPASAAGKHAGDSFNRLIGNSASSAIVSAASTPSGGGGGAQNSSGGSSGGGSTGGGGGGHHAAPVATSTGSGGGSTGGGGTTGGGSVTVPDPTGTNPDGGDPGVTIPSLPNLPVSPPSGGGGGGGNPLGGVTGSLPGSGSQSSGGLGAVTGNLGL
jgi:hypothetical protein